MTSDRRTLRLDLAYDGTAFVGWQRQARGRTVQCVIEDALGTFLAPGAPGLSVMGASRTDAGVHASGQVASVRVPFAAPADAVCRALNTRLPPDVRVLGVSEADSTFHARFDARAKRYRYRIATTPVLSPFDRWFVWHLPYPAFYSVDMKAGSSNPSTTAPQHPSTFNEPPNVDAMRTAAECLVGRYDFTSFQARGGTTLDAIRTMTNVEVVAVPGEIQIVVEGTGFVRHQVRIMVGSLLEVGSGRQPAAWLADALLARRREAAGPTAPAAGLTLEHVRY